MVICLPRETKTYNAASARACTYGVFRRAGIADRKGRKADIISKASRCASHDNDGCVQHTLASCNTVGATDMVDVIEVCP